MPILKTRDWRDHWKPEKWWSLTIELWEWLGVAHLAATEAQTLLDARAVYFDEWKRVGGRYNDLVEALHTLEKQLGHRHTICLQLRKEIKTAREDITALDERSHERAFDEETLEEATRRRLFAHGVKPYRIGRWMNPDTDTSETSDQSETVIAKEHRAVMRRYYQGNIDVLLDIFEDARAGAPVFAPIGQVVMDRHDNRYASRYPTPMDVARRINILERELAQLTPQPR